ncbi:MAG TPA: stage II sporulation protein R [Firmicutes bacterium]|nr:stage II sporulation protein R [Bacillota bacterium]
MKIVNIAAAMGIIAAISFSLMGFGQDVEEIRENVLRLHILANSDSEEDQQLKLKVRDRLLEVGGEIFENTGSKEEMISLAEDNTERLTAAAKEVINENGYDYDVRIEVGETKFDERVYNEVTMPAGVYTAVNVYIGEAAGHNWWCVMFPPMCLPAAEESEELDDVLSDEQLDIVENNEKYEIRLKALEIFDSIKEKISDWIG